jgi:hypothetical protein
MSKIYVLLGRAGDILGALPMFYSDSLRGERHKLMVCSEFISLLDGVSYVEPVEFLGHQYELEKACKVARALNGEACSLQVKGPVEVVEEWTWKPSGLPRNVQRTSFDQEPWGIAGRLNEWGKHPLVFDKRNPEREAALLAKVLPTKRGRKKPLMLVSTGGISSPFPYKEILYELLALKFGKTYRIIDLANVVADRFFDLLALLERAAILVATDSAPLHLARAVPNLPVVALTNDQPNLWYGTAWAPNHLWYCRYGDFQQRATEMLEAIDRYLEVPKYKKRRIVHVWSEYQTRGGFGKSNLAYKFGSEWLQTPVWIGSCGRDSANTIKDTQRFPYLIDALRMGMAKALPEDVIVLTKPDTLMTDSTFCDLLDNAACYAYRIENDAFKPVVDMFSATRERWKEILKDTPDLILGKDYWWSQALWAIFKKHGAVDVTGCVYRETKK